MDFVNGMRLAAALLSLLLMGLCGLRLLARFVRVLRGQERADGLTNPEPPAVQATPAARAMRPGRTGRTGRTASTARELLLAALVTLASRLLLYALAYALYRLLGIGDKGFFASLEPLWTHWDTRHYTGIALEGYTAVGDERLRLVFFPLYPMLMRLFSPLAGGNVFFGGLIVSLLCAAASGALLYDLCRMHFSRGTARLALAYFLLNPLSVFLCCAYTESLFICLTLAAVWLLRRGHPWIAALCGAAGALTRMPGVIVAGLFLIRLLGDIPRGKIGAKAVLRCAAQMGVVFMGLAAYWMINKRVTGNAFTYMVYQRENWYQMPGTFWDTVRTTVDYMISSYGDSDWLFSWAFQCFSLFYVFELLATRSDELPFDLAAYAFVYVAVVLAPTWLLSGARYLFALAPLPMLQARAHRQRRTHALVLAHSALLLVLWVYGYTIAIDVF